MQKYQKIKAEREKPSRDEIKVKKDTHMGSYLAYAHARFSDEKDPSEALVFKAAGNAISKLIPTIELIKHRIEGLYQNTKISTLEIKDEYEPLEEGLDRVVISRKVTMLEITLSKKPLD